MFRPDPFGSSPFGSSRRFLVDPNPNFAPSGYRVIAASAEIGVPQLTSLIEQ